MTWRLWCFHYNGVPTRHDDPAFYSINRCWPLLECNVNTQSEINGEQVENVNHIEYFAWGRNARRLQESKKDRRHNAKKAGGRGGGSASPGITVGLDMWLYIVLSLSKPKETPRHYPTATPLPWLPMFIETRISPRGETAGGGLGLNLWRSSCPSHREKN